MIMGLTGLPFAYDLGALSFLTRQDTAELTPICTLGMVNYAVLWS
jgi:hypothetical protein